MGCYERLLLLLLRQFEGEARLGETRREYKWVNEWVRTLNPLPSLARWLIGEKITIAQREFAILDTLGRHAPLPDKRVHFSIAAALFPPESHHGRYLHQQE
jgi:hypothetical protein